MEKIRLIPSLTAKYRWPVNVFLYTSLVLIVLALFSLGRSYIMVSVPNDGVGHVEIKLHQLFVGLSLYYSLCFLIYVLVEKLFAPARRTLTKLHFGFVTLSYLIFFYSFFQVALKSPVDTRFSDFIFGLTSSAFVAFVVAHLLFFINIVRTFLATYRTRT